MSKINEIVQVNNTLGSEVNLVEELFDSRRNAVRMSSYMPTKGHRDALEKLIKGLYDNKDKKCYVLNGSYGTGKSNLLLMYANYLLNSSRDDKVLSFFENYTEREKDDLIDDYMEESEKESVLKEINIRINRIKSYRETDKPHFVALCKYGTDGDFTAVVLRALKEAFEREGIEGYNLDSIYHEAIRKIKMWEEHKGESDFYDKLCGKLSKTDRDIEDFIGQLGRIEPNALDEFKMWHKKFIFDDFTYGKDNLVDILKETISSSSFQERYSGLTIFYDEFGDILKNHKFNEVIFQEFGELCQNSLSYGMPLIFVATTHKSFTSYSEHYQKDEFKKVSDRFEDISLSTEGFEDIMGAIVKPVKENQEWVKNIGKGREFPKLAAETKKLKLFDYIKGKKLNEKIIKNLFPMHPVATYALLEISKEMASNNRSVFSFFTRGEFEKYIEDNEIVRDEKLNFYTLDRMVEYFGREKFSSDNSEIRSSLRNKIRNYETSMESFFRYNRSHVDTLSPTYMKIMDVMLIFSLIDIPAKLDTVAFTLNSTKDEKTELQSYIDNLTKNNIIYKNQSTETYEFKQSDLLDVHGVISEYLSNNEGQRIDIVSELGLFSGKREFNRINSLLESIQNGTLPLPRLKGDFKYKHEMVDIATLESQNYISGLKSRREKQSIFDCSYDGYFLSVLCENASEVERAKRAAEKISSDDIIIAIPKIFKDLKSSVLGIKAIESSPRLKNLKPQEQIICETEKKKYLKELYRSMDELTKESNLDFYINGDKEVLNVGNIKKELVTKVLEKRYKDNLPLLDLALNKRFKDLTPDENRTYQELISLMLNLNEELIYDPAVSGRVDDRYLKPFTDSKILIESNGVLATSKNLQDYEFYPALKMAMGEIEKGSLLLTTFKDKLLKKYALGKPAMVFIVAFLYRHFEGNLSFIGKSGTNESVTTIQQIESFIKSGEEIKKIEISDKQKTFISNLFKLFNGSITLKEKGNLKNTHEELKNWFKSLESYQKIESLHRDGIVSIFEGINRYSQEEFLLGELHKVIEREADEVLTEDEYNQIYNEIASFKDTTDRAHEILIDNLNHNLAQEFNRSEDEIYQYFMKYFEELEEYKKNETFSKHTSETRWLLKLLKLSKENFNFLENILNQYENGYKDWTFDKTKSASKHLYKAVGIMNSLYLIPDPKIKFEGEHELKGNSIYFGENFKVIVENLDTKNYTTYYTLGEEGIKVNEAKGTQNIKALNDKKIDGIKNNYLLYILNEEGENGRKKQSNELYYRFKSIESKFTPDIEVKPGNVQRTLGSSGNDVREPEEGLKYDYLPKKKKELQSAIKGMIETTTLKSSEIKNKDIVEILEKLAVEYSRRG